MKVFVSIPMNGRSIEDVKYDQNHCLEELTRDLKSDGTLKEDTTDGSILAASRSFIFLAAGVIDLPDPVSRK